MHEPTLIATIAAGFTVALILGLLTQRLGLSPIVGYLVGGILIGPYTPGFVGDVGLASQLAEVGVILLMFGVGLHFHLKELLAVKWVAIPGAVGQSVIATVVTMLVFTQLGLSWQESLVLGMALAVASTVVLMRVLMDANELNSVQGSIAVGWLIVEDIITVGLLVLIPVLGHENPATAGAESGAEVQSVAATPTAASILISLGLALLKLGFFVFIVFQVGSRVIPWALVKVARLRSRELFTLTVLVFSVAVAAGSYFVFGASMALGAFLAGMVVAQSPVSHQAAADALPMRDAFAVLFFVSVGMLFDPRVLLTHPTAVLAALGIVLLVKPLAALLVVAILGQSAKTALTVSIGLAQIGEFSFILSELARHHGLMPQQGHDSLVAAAIISITLNPLLFLSIPAVEGWLKSQPVLWRLLAGRAERQALASNEAIGKRIAKSSGDSKQLAIVVGYGPVGRSVHRILSESGQPSIIIDMNMDTVSALKRENQAAIFGDAANASILEAAGIRNASHFVLTLPHSTERASIVAEVRNLNPNVRIFVRARYLRERELLEQAGANAAVFEEVEAAISLARLVLADVGIQSETAQRKLQDLRLQLITENVIGIRSQRVRSIMAPWSRVHWISKTASRSAVFEQISKKRYSRWPVVDPTSGMPVGYLLTKDLIASDVESDWTSVIRPIRSVDPEETIESALTRMQEEDATIYIVSSNGQALGIITFEDIVEQVVGQIEDEYPHDAAPTLPQAILRGGILLGLKSKTISEAIHELVQVIPSSQLPSGTKLEDVLQLAQKRESTITSDLGNGVAVPHARCEGLAESIVVFGKSPDGLLGIGDAGTRVTLLFLLVTPAEKPETQLSLLAQIATICRERQGREKLFSAKSPAEALEVIGGP